MTLLTRAFGFCLTVAICLACFATAVVAAPSRTYSMDDVEANNQAVEELAKEIEEKFGITIFYPTSGEGYKQMAEIFPEMLKTLDAALTTVTPELVREVSKYYYDLNGRRLTFSYTYADLRGPYGLFGKQEVMVGLFDKNSSRIELYIPQQKGEAIATGDNPLTIVHEFAHALQLMLIDSYGYYRMEREWNALMDNEPYGKGLTDKKVFITEYASTDFEEDFAETFAHLFICDRPGLGFSWRLYEDKDVYSPLGKKADYIERLLKRYFDYSEKSIENLRKIYETPASVNEAGIKLSGQHLIFMGLDEPRTIPLMLLNNLAVYERGTVWFSDIGGWYCRDFYGNHLVLFPEGTYGNPGRDLLQDAIDREKEKKAELEAQLEAQKENEKTAGSDGGTPLAA